MSIVSTHYRGTPARPRAHEITCMSTPQSYVHIQTNDSEVVLELSGRDGCAASISLSVADSHRLGELLVSVAADHVLRTPTLLHAHEQGVDAA